MTKPLVVTMTLVLDCWLNESLNVAVQLTAATPVTVKVAFGPCGFALENVAFPAQLSDSVKVPL
jgi:hypothetical protein